MTNSFKPPIKTNSTTISGASYSSPSLVVLVEVYTVKISVWSKMRKDSLVLLVTGKTTYPTCQNLAMFLTIIFTVLLRLILRTNYTL